VVEQGGGEVRLRADAESIDVVDGRVVGVSYAQGGKLYQERSRHVISTMGLINTLERLPA
jgi:phytoene dehydrogenase-like protein